MKCLIFILIINLLLLSSCEKDISTSTIKTDQCNKNHLPVLMLHGFLAASDTYNNFYQLFSSNGYCNNALYVMDRNTLNLNADFNSVLDSMVNHILTNTNHNQINLIGHSAGGGLGYTYLNDSLSKNKVANYVHLASFPQSEPAGKVATLNIWSMEDLIVKGDNIEGAENLILENADHYQVATSSKSFQTIFEFFNNDEKPQYTSVQKQQELKISGKVVTLGENVPVKNTTVNIYPLDENTGKRLDETPEHTLTTDEYGNWNVVNLKPNQPYEFFVRNPNNTEDRPMHYYRENFTRSTPLVYLRTIPPKGSLARIILGDLPAENEQAVTVIFSASQAIINGRDQLTFNGNNLSIPEFTSPDQSTIALFLYDDGDKNSSFTLHQNLLASQPFLNAVDIYTNPAEQQISTLTLNDKTLKISNWASADEGISVVVFD